MENKKLFKDKRWTEKPDVEVVGYKKVTQEESERADKELEKTILKEKG